MRVHLTEIMLRFDVESYLCGHDHNLQYVESDGLHEFISGGGAWFYDWDWYLGARTMDTAELKFGTSTMGFWWFPVQTIRFILPLANSYLQK